MRLMLTAIGRLRSGPERDLVDDYLARARAAGRSIGLTGVEEVEIEPKTEVSRIEETRLLLAALPADAVVIALDERGRSIASRAFADKLAAWRDQGRRACALIIGGADGLDETARARADLVLGFGAQTWPHRLARVMAAEQIYRAITILTGSPYHRD